MKFQSIKILFIATLATATTFGSALADHHKPMAHEAVAVVRTTDAKEAPDTRVLGQIHFIEKNGKTHVKGKLSGLKPNSVHGFHIHQYGDFSKMDGTSAGGHFNPHGTEHAGPDAKMHHVGDLGNIKANSKGEVNIDMIAEWVTVDHGENAVLGRSVVLHAGEDDLTSQPSGAAGARIGVGVIGWANPSSK